MIACKLLPDFEKRKMHQILAEYDTVSDKTQGEREAMTRGWKQEMEERSHRYCGTGMRTRNAKGVEAVGVGMIMGQEGYLVRRQVLKEWRERSDGRIGIQVVRGAL